MTGADLRGGTALGADGAIYVGSHDAKLYAIAPTGQVRWKLAAADKIQGRPAIATDLLAMTRPATVWGTTKTHDGPSTSFGGSIAWNRLTIS